MWTSDRRAPARRACPPCNGGRRRALIACGTLLAAGCASVAPPRTPAPSTQPEGPREWSGRFSVTARSAAGDGQLDAAAGRFVLASVPQPAGRALDLTLVSPFGQTLASGRRAADGASTLSLADGRTFAAGTLDGLVEQALGWSLPVERLPDWLDDRFERVVARDAEGRVVEARDSGWHIERASRRWALERPRPGGTLRVVLLLDP
jgi:outer membrane biogenesis lipoprotein LolB